MTAQRQVADALPPQIRHLRAPGLEHPAHQPVVPLVHRDGQVGLPLEPRVVGQKFHVRRSRAVAVVQRQAAFQPPQRLLGQLPAHPRDVQLFHLARGMRDALHQLPVVGQDQQPLGLVIEPPHGIDPLRDVGNQVAHRLSALRVGKRRHHALRLVEQDVLPPLFGLDGLAVHQHLVAVLHLHAHFADDAAVDAHAPLGDDLLALAPRRDPAFRHVFLQSHFVLSPLVCQKNAVSSS